MKRKLKTYDVIVIACTLCLAVVLAVVAVVRVRPHGEISPDREKYTFNLNNVEPSKGNVENEQAFLTDAVWEDMRFLLSGVEYALPCDVGELESHGWELSVAKTVGPKETVGFEAYYGGAAVQGDLYNPSDAERDAQACPIVKISFTWANAVLPGNLKLMESTVDDVYAKYGEPLYANETMRSVTYETIDLDGGMAALTDENRPGVSFFYNEDGKIVFAELYCGTGGEESDA